MKIKMYMFLEEKEKIFIYSGIQLTFIKENILRDSIAFSYGYYSTQPPPYPHF